MITHEDFKVFEVASLLSFDRHFEWVFETFFFPAQPRKCKKLAARVMRVSPRIFGSASGSEEKNNREYTKTLNRLERATKFFIIASLKKIFNCLRGKERNCESRKKNEQSG